MADSELRAKGLRINEKRFARVMRTFPMTAVRDSRVLRTTEPRWARTGRLAGLLQRSGGLLLLMSVVRVAGRQGTLMEIPVPVSPAEGTRK
ncbi:hypothetical protein ACH45E_16625 [Streptomyces sp. NPDC020299]|uniref:hypothetical protein n=1 Tax=Streptomyces sp. NPDC020299 TaxID=3365067 RepID=UPI0037B5E711